MVGTNRWKPWEGQLMAVRGRAQAYRKWRLSPVVLAKVDAIVTKNDFKNDVISY